MIKPLGDRIVVEPLEVEKVTKGGIVLPGTAKEKPQSSKVVAVGPGKMTDDGKRIPMELKVGDVVIHSTYGGTEFSYENKDYMIFNERDILAVM